MSFFKHCGKKYLINFFAVLILLITAYSLGKGVTIYLKADVLEDFIQTYFEINEANTTKMIDILVQHRDLNKKTKKILEKKFPDSNSFGDSLINQKKKNRTEIERYLKEIKIQIKELKKYEEFLEDILEKKY